jgi:hypothetical protein
VQYKSSYARIVNMEAIHNGLYFVYAPVDSGGTFNKMAGGYIYDPISSDIITVKNDNTIITTTLASNEYVTMNVGNTSTENYIISYGTK